MNANGHVSTPQRRQLRIGGLEFEPLDGRLRLVRLVRQRKIPHAMFVNDKIVGLVADTYGPEEPVELALFDTVETDRLRRWLNGENIE